MSEGAPSKRLPRRVEPRKQAHFGAVYQGSLDAEDLPRLASHVHSIDEIHVRLAFYIDDNGKRVVAIDTNANVDLLCQRCLEPVMVKVSSQSVVAIVRDEDEAKQLSESLDPWIVNDTEADTYELVEEELLLNLPVVAFHEHDCVNPDLYEYEIPDSEKPREIEGENPFNVLAGLKGKLKNDLDDR